MGMRHSSAGPSRGRAGPPEEERHGAHRGSIRDAREQLFGAAERVLLRAGHLLFADREGGPPEGGAVRQVVTTVIAGVARSVTRQAAGAAGILTA